MEQWESVPQLPWLIGLCFSDGERKLPLLWRMADFSEPTFSSVSMKSKLLFADASIVTDVYCALISVRDSKDIWLIYGFQLL